MVWLKSSDVEIDLIATFASTYKMIEVQPSNGEKERKCISITLIGCPNDWSKTKLELINDIGRLKPILLISFINGPSVYTDENEITGERKYTRECASSLSLSPSHSPPMQMHVQSAISSNSQILYCGANDKNNEWLTLQKANTVKQYQSLKIAILIAY